VNRIALVVGNATYLGRSLPNAAGDAREVARALRKRSFKTKLLIDADAAAINKALASVRRNAKEADIALFYFAGHAVERSGVGFVLPTDFPFPVDASATKIYGVGLDRIVDAIKPSKSSVVVLDGCRNWPIGLDDQAQMSRHLDEMAAEEKNWTNTLFAYSTSSTKAASDGVPGEGSRFCTSFCRHVLDHTISIDECFRRVCQDVVMSSPNRQQPWTYSSLQRSLSFSDLPQFYPTQRHNVPASGSWFALDHFRQGVLAGGDNSSVWQVTPASFKLAVNADGANIVGIATPKRHLVFGTRLGELVISSEARRTQTNTGYRDVHGLTTSPDGRRFVQYGQSSICVFTIKSGQAEKLGALSTAFELYSCVFLDNDTAWLGGENGSVVEVDLRKTLPVFKELVPRNRFSKHINGMSVSNTGRKIYSIGARSHLAEMNRLGKVTRVFLPGRQPQTPPGIRTALSQHATDQAIHRYLFNPSLLGRKVRAELDELRGQNDFVSCAHAPGMPILAVGTEEGTVLLVDSRDGQLYQEIEVSKGAPGSITAITFLSDGELVVMSYDGIILFLSAKYS